jgi:hypothetical protein
MNVRTRPLDTSEAADKVQIEIYRRMTPERRLQLGLEASALSFELQAAGVRFRHPEYSDEETRVAVTRINLGDELFLRVYPARKLIVP